MRKIFAFIMTTLDGYYEGPGGEFDFWVLDDEFEEFSVQQLDEVDALLFGRVTYEAMAAYWPTPEAEKDDPRVARRMNGLSKIVVSRTLDEPEWANTRLIAGDVERELSELKERPGKDVAILGSSALTLSLIEMGLLDELRLMINPVVLGAGKSVFRGAGGHLRVELLKSRGFSSGSVLLYYRPASAA
ncbi:MAG TPA: dihydrofolate reductase family protein [Thermoleophilaceae bacterium]|nr:dihydrofolate reductase family protein [Thermoleophilaceae bacterium]